MSEGERRARERRQEIQVDTLRYVKRNISGLTGLEAQEWLNRQIAFLDGTEPQKV